MPVQPHLIETPTTERVRFDLFDTIGLKPLPEKGIAGGIQYDTEFCGPARPWSPPCIEPDPATKTADDGVDQTIGAPIPVYHLFSCRLPGGNFEGRAERALDLGASRAVEAGLVGIIGTGATDLGGPFGIVRAIAELEQYAGANYGGRAVIHLTRKAALMGIAAQAIFQIGDHLETGLGSLVVAGAGYAGSALPSAPAAGAEWGYVTGAVNLYEGTVRVNEQGYQRANGGYTNEYVSLSERVYVPTFECIHGAVEIQIAEAP